jgi:tRNA guanosine-2'-O-methyltransferase
LRSLETMCILSRFVTADIVDEVCKGSFETFASYNTHHALRYFAEIFCIQCARKFPVPFGAKLVQTMHQSTHSNQTIASLMIVAGNLVIGRYQSDFMPSAPIKVEDILYATIPWLSSTQSFTRGIAQLLSHQLITKLQKEDPERTNGSALLLDIYRFLNENHEMIRLRKKQSTFFEEYDADAVSTPEGLFAIGTDDNGDSTPLHLVSVLKEVLKELCDDIGDDEAAPAWKRIEMSRESEIKEVQQAMTSSLTESFQRKISPTDYLNLRLEDEKTRNIRNRAGRRKQDLIVCASLIDKVPNLGGLARTAEIFAAQKLVIPDLSLTKMDHFTSISVGAGDWIDIEECHEKVRYLSGRMSWPESLTLCDYTKNTIPRSVLKYFLKINFAMTAFCGN